MKRIIFLAFSILIAFGCDDRDGINPCDPDYDENKPKLSLQSFEGSKGSYSINYNVEQTGNDEEAIIGIAINTSPAPVKDASSIDLGIPEVGDDVHQFEISTLGTYYARVYIENCLGIFYSNELSISQSQENTISIESIEYIEDENGNGCINANEKLYYRLVVKNNSSNNIEGAKIVISSADAFVNSIGPDTLIISSILSQESKFIASDKTPSNVDYSFYIESATTIDFGLKKLSFAIIENGVPFLQEREINIEGPNFDTSLSLVSAGGDMTIEEGEKVTYEISLTNNGSIASNNVVLTPNDLSGGKITSFAPSVINFGNVNPNGGSVTRTIELQLASSIAEGTEISFEYTISDDCDVDFTPEAFSFFVSSVSLTIDGCALIDDENEDGFINVGEKVKIRVDVENIGLSEVNGIEVTFASSDFYSATTSIINSISSGGFASVDIDVEFNDDVEVGNFTLEAIASVGPINFTGNCNTTFEIKPKDLPNLIVESYAVVNTTSNDDIINLGEDVELSLVIKNNGTLLAEDVKLEFIDSDVSSIDFSDQNLGNISSGGSMNTSINFDVSTSTATGERYIDVNLNTSGLDFERRLEIQVEDIIRPTFDISSQIQNDNEPNPCERVRYKLDIENTSSVDASNVTLTLQKNSSISNITKPMGSININSGSTESLFVEFDINENTSSGLTIILEYVTTCTECNGNTEGDFSITLGDLPQPDIDVDIVATGVEAGKMGEITITIENMGGRNAVNLNGSIETDNNNIMLMSTSFSVGDLSIGADDMITINTEVSAAQINDEEVIVSITLTDSKGFSQEYSIPITVGGLITETNCLQTYITFDDQNLNDLIGGQSGINQGIEFSDCTPQDEGKSAFFGGDSYFYYPGLNPSAFEGPTSFNLWVKTYFTKQEPLITSDNKHEVEIVSNEMMLGNGAATLPESFTDGQWHMLTFTFDGDDSKYYVDGLLYGTDDNTFVDWANSGDIYFGYYEYAFSGPKKHFDGYMDNIRIYNKELYQPSITNIYNSEKPSNPINYNVDVDQNLLILYDYENSQLGYNRMDNWESKWNAVNFSVGETTNTPSSDSGSAALFDGSGYFTNSNAILNQMYSGSISFWVKANMLNNNCILKGDANNSNSTYLRIVQNNLQYGSASFNNGISSIFDNTWNHVVITSGRYSGSTEHKLYLNGQLYGTTTTNQFNPSSTDGEFNIGIKPFSSNQNDFIGSLDNFRIYAKELTSNEVNAIYNAEN